MFVCLGVSGKEEEEKERDDRWKGRTFFSGK